MTLEGTVEATNERGLRLGGEWLNVSKFKPIPLPAPGARVRAEVDAKGFLKSVDVLDSEPTPALSRPDTTTTRLAVLQAAASFLGQMGQVRQEVRSEHVLVLADRWLAWVEAE